MSREYIISEDKGYKKGNGTQVCIEDGRFFCEILDEHGDAGGMWFCDIEILMYHIENYKKLRQLEKLTGEPMSCIMRM